MSVICNVHSGARSREGVVHRALLSIPRSQERTVERHLDVLVLQLHVSSATSSNSLQFWGGPGTTWNSHAALDTGTVRRLANLFPCVREFIEVILLHPREAQRWIALGNRESRCTMACSAPSGGSLLQRIISSTHGHHRLAQLRVY